MNDMLSQFHDWQIWVPIGVALVIAIPGLLLIATACNSIRKKNPEGEDSPLASGLGCLACFVLLFVSAAAGICVVNQMDPTYFSEEAPCVSCGATVLKTDEYCAECGIEQIEQSPTCAGCGEEIRDNVKFCTSCGTPAETQPTIPTCPTCKVPCDTAYCPDCGALIP